MSVSTEELPPTSSPLAPVAAAQPTLLVVGTSPSTNEEAKDAALNRSGCRILKANEPNKALDYAHQCDLLLIHLDKVADPLTLIAHIWCAIPSLPILALVHPSEDSAQHLPPQQLPNAGISKSALRMGVYAVVSDQDEKEIEIGIRLALAQGRLHASQFTRDLSRTLSSIQAYMGDALKSDQLQPALEEVAELFRAERASLLLFDDPHDDEDAMKMVAHLGFAPGIPETIRIRKGEGVAGIVAQDGIPQLILRSLQDYQKFSDLSSNRNIQASLAVPVRATATRGKRPILGVLNLARLTENDVFIPRDLEVCEFVATSIGEMLTRLRQNQAGQELQHQMAAVEKLSYAGEMAAGIAHEVANPVSFIHSNLKVLQEYLEELQPAFTFAEKEYPDSAEWKDALDDLPSLVHETLEGADRALHIIQEMKSMVRLQSGDNEKAPVSLASLCQKSLRLLRPRLVGKCRLEVSLDDDAVVLGNEVELSQVLVNLVVNAADACSERHASEEDALVHVQVFQSAEAPFSTNRNPGPRCVLQVQDNGCGIAKGQLERIFAPLFTTKPKGGTGLGLGIVRRIVDAHEGKIRVRSTENVGTIFEVWLPANAP